MTNELLRMVADALKHPGFGVNAQLPGVPRDAGDPLPTDVAVYDASRDGWVARRKLSRDDASVQMPHVAVMLLNDLELDGEVMTTYRDGRATLLIAYGHRELDTHVALTAGGYVLRAIQRTLRQLHDPANAALCVRNGIAFKICTGVREVPMGAVQQAGIDTPITAALAVSYDLRDLAP